MNKSAGILEIEAGITVMHNGFERIFSSVPIHFGKGVSLANGAYIYCTGEGDDIYIGDYRWGACFVSGNKNWHSLFFWYWNYNCCRRFLYRKWMCHVTWMYYNSGCS